MEIVEDEKVFGKDQYVYCYQHLNVHSTGWCTVSCNDKVGLGVEVGKGENGKQENLHRALEKCKRIGLKLYNHK